jgi:hypothetical protein
MDEVFNTEEHNIVRCFCCSNWVRMSATKIAKTGVRGDDELWCVGCLRDVDAFTLTLEQPELQQPSTLELEEGD